MADFDVVVVGSGPGGYVAAIRASQLGLKTALVERSELGGICLNWGCIPSKSLLRNAEVVSLVASADKWGITFDNLSIDFGKAIDRSRQVVQRLTKGIAALLKKNAVEVIKGDAKVVDRNTLHVNSRQFTAKNIIIATGARSKALPNLEVDGKLVVTSREALETPSVPSHVIIVGGGATGLEFAYLYHSYGSEVTVIEMMARILPNEDEEISQLLERAFTKSGIRILTNATVKGLTRGNATGTLTVESKEGSIEIEGDRILVAVGVKGNGDNIGLEELGVTILGGFIQVNDQMATEVPGIYAIGDVTGKMLLAHVASAQGVYLVENIAGEDSQEVDYTNMPRATYCIPQVTSFGLTEAQAKARGLDYKIGKFPLLASGKALALGDTEGLVKLVVGDDGDILGAHMIGAEVTELLAELSLARLLEGTNKEIGSMVHAHPSISEAIKEAALDVDGQAIHI